jgi:hypothetical protein
MAFQYENATLTQTSASLMEQECQLSIYGHACTEEQGCIYSNTACVLGFPHVPIFYVPRLDRAGYCGCKTLYSSCRGTKFEPDLVLVVFSWFSTLYRSDFQDEATRYHKTSSFQILIYIRYHFSTSFNAKYPIWLKKVKVKGKAVPVL